MKKVIKILNSTIKIVKYILPDRFIINGRLGFEDPYYTGLFTAGYYSMYSIINRYDIDIQTVFDKEVYEGEGGLEGSISIAFILLLLLRIIYCIPDKIFLLKMSILNKLKK
jgi:hypothetical protein